MYIRNILISGLAAASTVQAYNNDTFGEDEKWIVADPPPVQKRQFINIFGLLSNIFGGGGGNKDDPSECPAIWTQISATLTQQFSANGECTDAARAAIRAAFHDCFPGACDGSLILANECAQAPSRGLQRFCSNLAGVASQTNVGVGDLIQFAAAHAVKTCPEGPTVPIRIGRQDSSRENDWRILPRGDARGNDVVRLFTSRGFTPVDLAALLGAHSTAKQQFVDPSQAGAALDSTPGVWDIKYYTETLRGNAPFTLPADRNVARNPATALAFASFGVSKKAWDDAFVVAMVKMGMMGVTGRNMIDCTSALPKTSAAKREVKEKRVSGRFTW
ncbi:hypothetical protein COCVIDRAFT_85161 [Bipolaris victoriae FI3]|uniref:Peroxidase n=2 Tax=Bipolaris TaxID=33194 RepID=W6Z466_COCC2|nr:uncharacterized protein COCCADRAFT_82769 [Bipolaris zeicola 26-R-13]XP_014561905.1 hypothetical protein COCVIDRAFT_85161 [Bipolaris victoriae FI3]EUC38486.1 hypothetical protein COCCADRAFT_82769 [Bipolaris zeicola 26-R-13]